MEQRTAVSTALAIVAIIVVAAIGVGYAYTATYTEDASQEAEVSPTYISIAKTSEVEMSEKLTFTFSTKNSAPGVNDVIVDTSKPMTVVDDETATEVEFEESDTGWIATDETNKRQYTLTLGNETQAEAVLLVGSYQINHYGSDLDVSVSASKAQGDDPTGIITLTLSAEEDYGGEASPITVSAGDTVHVYAHVDISEVFGTAGYGTVTIPSITLSVTAQPEEI